MTPDASALLSWYDRHHRTLPWRTLPSCSPPTGSLHSRGPSADAAKGRRPDPYAVWLSEIMLQQTTVKAVIPYFERFLTRYPKVQDLAEAPLDDVLHLWAGLGYYARARNLHACAQEVAALGGFPDTVEQLLELPGIGAYTARAIAAIAFGRPVVPVDGNVERVTARLNAFTDPLPTSRPRLARLATLLNDDPAAQRRPSDFAQALFDLGATVCTPRNPSCLTCPWQTSCLAHRKGIAGTLPVKLPRTARPTRYGAVFLLRNGDGILLRARPPSGLLGGMDEFPGTPWRDAPHTKDDALAFAPIDTRWTERGEIRHVFTHFALILSVWEACLPAGHNAGIDPSFGTFRSTRRAALPGVMKKCLALSERAAESR